MGRLKVQALDFLSKEVYANLVNSKDLLDVAKTLEATVYGPDIAAVATAFQGSQRLELAINRMFVRRCRRVLDSSPFSGKPIVGAYLRRYDVENIGLVLSSKAQGRALSENEQFLVSSREFPAGLFAGAMSIDDFRQLSQQPTLEAATQQLVKYGYGGLLMTRLDNYLRTRDIFPLLHALEEDYYAKLLGSIRHFQGDEWNIRLFVQSEIDVRNTLLLLKGKDADLPADDVMERFIDGGLMPRSQAGDVYTSRGVPELVQALSTRYPSLPEGLSSYQANRTLTAFESALTRDRALGELKRLRSYPLSLAILFGFLMRADLERTDLRRIVYGKQYGVPAQALSEQLVVPRI
jgi:V/A-type H+-transporting ATPase subunit C